MPRIDPIQLLKCLGVLLSSNGGIKSTEEVERLANLMMKFSKKLVSKCIYIQILKCTETELLGMFMGAGGWILVHMWLTESIAAKNWPLVTELLELLLLCPVDIDRLKTNNCPKLVKGLSKNEYYPAISALASKLVEQWLKIVKGENVETISMSDISQIISDAADQRKSDTNIVVKAESLEVCKDNVNIVNVKVETKSEVKNEVAVTETETKIKTEIKPDEQEILPVLKISMKDGKQIISHVEDAEAKHAETLSEKEKSKHRSKEKSSDKHRSSSSSSKSSSSKHSSKSSSDRHRSSSHKSSSRDKSKDKDRDKHSPRSSSKSSKNDNNKKSSERSSSGKSNKEDKISRESENLKDTKPKDKKDKDDKTVKETASKTEKSNEPPSIHKLGKIPKLSDVKKDKPSISIEVRKPDEPKPKTVKTFHSKFRSHGLEEEVRPPPSRASLLNKKVPPVLPPTVSIPKRPSPVHNESTVEKKPKVVEPIEKPGAIKLIPPKPKPMLLLESDMFMDALNASATNKKEPKKRKRRTSGSKDGSAGDGSPPHTPTSLSSPSSESKSVPPRFYQDTLENEDEKDKSSEKDDDNGDDIVSPKRTKKEVAEEEPVESNTLTVNGLKGVLCYHKRKGPKKSIKWKPDSELEEVQYFELDETERVNVTKNFTDMKNLDTLHEREAFQKGRNVSTDDVMEERTSWKPLILIEAEGQIHVEYGKHSKEKELQAIRQKGTLQPLYFHKSMIPDSAFEAEPETHTYSEPTIIPLEDITGNQDNISDFRNMPWPEPKGNAPPVSNTNMNVPPMFQQNLPQFPNGFPNTPFPGMPGFQGPNMIPGEWPNAVPAMLANGMPNGAMPPMAPGGLPPGAILTPDGMMITPDMFGAPNGMFPPGPPEGFNMMDPMNMPPNMFPPDFNMGGGPPQGPPGSEGFPVPGNFRGPMRGRGSWRGKGAGNWDGPQRGRGGMARGGRKTVCIYFQRKGSCRQGDNCTFLHPGVNGPY